MMRRAVFTVINILLLPITLLGYAIWVGGIRSRRTSDVSVTAQGPLTARWFMHQLGVRRDEAAHRLLPVVPGVRPLGLRLAAWPMLLAHRLTGYVPQAFRYPFEGDIAMQYEASARQTFFDKVVERHLARVDQVVSLGAGFDTRAYGGLKDPRVRIFEVDMPRTQAVKRTLLEKAGIDASGVTFVAADLGKDDWLVKLVDAGFDPSAPALFLWEGVVMYLEKAAVEATLRKIAGTAPGSVVAFDYFTTEPIESPALYWRYARATTKAAGEPLKFGIDSTPPSRERVAELLLSCGLTLDEQRTLGDERHGKRAWGGVVTAVVSPRSAA